MKKLLIVAGDYNGADYLRSVNLLDDDEYTLKILELLPKISDALKNCSNRHNWPNSEYSRVAFDELYGGILTEDEIGIMNEYVPHGEYQIHSITSIKVYDVVNIIDYF